MRSLVKMDGCENKTFPTLDKGMIYFNKMKKKYKHTGKLMAIYKEVSDGKWIGHARN